MTQMLSHGNEVSGTTIFGDGTRVYWNEGRGADLVVIYPDGKIETIETWNLEQTPEQQAILREEQRIEEEGADINRMMTAEEEAEWEMIYHYTEDTTGGNDWWEMLCAECGHSYQAQEKNIETQKCPNCQGGTGTLPIESGTIQ